jgi:hypothetical protein
MQAKKIHEIHIYLDNIEHLFVAPDFDPYAKSPIYISGLDAASNEIKLARRRTSHKLILHLPAEKITPNLSDDTRLAILNYCEFKLQETRREALLLRWEGIEALQTGLLFMGGCLFLSLYLREAKNSPEFLRTFFSEGLSIVGWVSMWKPIDILLYQWWPHWQSLFIFEKLEVTEVEIEPLNP